MAINFPAVASVVGGVSFFSFGLRLRGFRVASTPPRPRAHLSREERQHKITITTRICYGAAALMVAGGVLLAWLAR